MFVPLKTTDRYFKLYELITLRVRIANSTKFVKFETKFPYFALVYNKRHYLRLTQTDVQRCYETQVTICPADYTVFSTAVNTCESSLFFQRVEARTLCNRRLLSSHFAPSMIYTDSGG
jgi:hypothetical protein